MIKRIRYWYTTAHKNSTYIVSAKRTPIGKFMGNLNQFSGA